MADYVVAVDVGNTHTRVGLVDARILTCVNREGFPTAELSSNLGPSLDAMIDRQDSGATILVAVSSVVTSIRSEADSVLSGRAGLEICWVAADASAPIALNYVPPEILGADRLANLLYAYRVCANRTSVIVDVGTAVTIDLLAEGTTFRGGAILPGIEAQLQSLHQQASALPRVDTMDAATPLPGTSTAASIRAGVLYGLAGAIEKTVQEYRKQVGSDICVLTTGGGWPLVAPFVGFPCTEVADMTLIGSAVYALERKDRGD